jgi:hypothetical protein
MSETKALAIEIYLQHQSGCDTHVGGKCDCGCYQAAAELVELERKATEFEAVYKLGLEINDKNVQLRADRAEAIRVMTGILQFLDDNGWGKDECVCDDIGDPSVGIGTIFCDYHRAATFLARMKGEKK